MIITSSTLTVTRYGNVVRASAELELSQLTVSRQTRQLVGARRELFDASKGVWS